MSSVRGCFAGKGRGGVRGRGKAIRGLCPSIGVGTRVATRRQLQKPPQTDENEGVEVMEEVLSDTVSVHQVLPATQNPSASIPVDDAVQEDVRANLNSTASGNVDAEQDAEEDAGQDAEQDAEQDAANNVQSSTSSRVRGMNNGIDEPANENDRVQVKLHSDGSFHPATVTRTIGVIVRKFMTVPSWKKVPEHIRNNMWIEFQGRYVWQKPTAVIQRAFYRKCADLYASALYETKEQVKACHRKTEISETKGLGPDWIHATIWDSMVDEWASQEWQRKSAAAKQNRLTEKDCGITKHTCGSIPITEHNLRLEKKLGRPVTEDETFNYVHVKRGREGNNQEYVDAKSKRVAESYNASYTAKYGSEPSSEKKFDIDLWVKAVGVTTTKGRVYGFGESKLMTNSFGSSTSSFNGGSSSETTSQPQPDIAQIREEMRAELRQEVREELRQEMRQMNEDLEQRLREMILNQAQGQNRST